jgi:ATP-binding cassette, subfamily B, bacterial
VTRPSRPTSHPVRDGLLPYARRHRRCLVRGLVFTALLVACRLALPLPLGAAVARSALPPDLQGHPSSATPWELSPTLLATGFIGLALLAGMAQYFQRLAFANFASRSINDARSAAHARVSSLDADVAGDLAAPVVADSGRVKQGLKGALNHIVLNIVFVLGACAALAFADPWLGLVQLAGLALVLVVSVASAKRVAAVARRHRDSEALLAAVVHRLTTAEAPDQLWHDVEALHELDADGGRAEREMTRRECQCTWIVHTVLATTAAVVLVLGSDLAAAGRLHTAVLATVVGYVLMLHGPAVGLARQISRLGVVLVSAHHLGLLLVEQEEVAQDPVGDGVERPGSVGPGPREVPPASRAEAVLTDVTRGCAPGGLGISADAPR